MEQIRILLIDDDEDDYFILKDLLDDVKDRYHVDWATGFEHAKELLGTAEFDLFLLDYRLGAFTGIDVLSYLKGSGNIAPAILLTGLENDQLDREAMAMGAADYLIKSKLDSQILDRTIRYALERAQSLNLITEKEEKYRKIFEHSGDLILFVNEHGVVLEGNEAAGNLLGLNYQILPDSLLAILISPEAEKAVMLSFKQKMEIRNQEISFKNSRSEDVDGLMSCWVHDAGEGVGIFIIQDISQQRSQERQQRAIDKLVSNERIAKIIAHEIRNPLTNINLSVENIEEDIRTAPGTDAKVYLDIIKRNASRINLLISELLNSTRFTEPDFTSHDIHKLIDDALLLAEDRIKLKGVTVERIYAPDICPVRADGDKIKIAILNLIINAVEAMEEHKGRLLIKTEANNGKCMINISDNGPGIPKEFLPRLFDPFFTRKANGTGLGLTSTQSIIFSHKGTIQVKSEEGKGTSFHIGLDLN